MPSNLGPYYSNPRYDLVRMVRGNELDILEIGCGNGATGALLRDAGIVRSLRGVEPHAPSAHLARQVFDRVDCKRVEDIDLSILKEKFDVVLAGDVLEHLLDPWGLTADLLEVLRPNGQLIVSVPNVRSALLVGPLIFRGRFEYRDRGILDRTHLRWFTRQSLLRMLEDAGFQIEDVRARRIADHRRVIRAAMRLIGPFGVTQYLVRSGRPQGRGERV